MGRTIVEIINIKYSEGKYTYTYRYECPESKAYNQQGEKIEGPIEQHTISDRKPKEKQKLRGAYDPEEPIFFKLLEEVAYE